METWLPDKIESGCMACHNKVASGRDDPPNNKDPLDYVFSLRVSAYPRGMPDLSRGESVGRAETGASSAPGSR
jgi:hypothetical protein